MGTFNTGFDTVNLHHLTQLMPTAAGSVNDTIHRSPTKSPS